MKLRPASSEYQTDFCFFKCIGLGTKCLRQALFGRTTDIEKEAQMGRGLLLWLIGIPIPIIPLVWLFGGLH
jgi:hypothetical protein